MVHDACFSVSIIHRTLTYTTDPLTSAQMLMHAIAHGGVRTHVRESALKVDSGRKSLSATEEPNLRQLRAGPMFYHPFLHLVIEHSYETCELMEIFVYFLHFRASMELLLGSSVAPQMDF